MKKIEDPFNLSRFRNTQSLYYKDDLEEIRRGKKETHWMWFYKTRRNEIYDDVTRSLLIGI